MATHCSASSGCRSLDAVPGPDGKAIAWRTTGSPYAATRDPITSPDESGRWIQSTSHAKAAFLDGLEPVKAEPPLRMSHDARRHRGDSLYASAAGSRLLGSLSRL